MKNLMIALTLLICAVVGMGMAHVSFANPIDAKNPSTIDNGTYSNATANTTTNSTNNSW